MSRIDRILLLVGLLACSLPVPVRAAAAQGGAAAGLGQTADAAAAELRLELEQAVELALRHNLQIRVESLEPEVAAEQIRFARGAFDPLFEFDLPRAFNRSSSPQASVLGGADVLSQEQITGGFRFGQDATALGTSWSLSGNLSRFVTNNAFSTFNPRYDTQLGLEVRQPLLRGFGHTVNRRTILVAANDYGAGREQFRERLQQSIVRVIEGYWELVRARRGLEIARQSLQLARDQLERNNTMVRIGVLAAVDVIQTEQQVADAELTALQAEIKLQDQQDQMKALLNLDAVTRIGWRAEIVPTTPPATEAPPIDVAAAVRDALANSPAVRRARLQLQSRGLDLAAAHNGLLPRLDLTGSIRLNGLGGDQIFRSGSVFGGSGIDEIQEGGLGDSFRQLLSGDFRNWSVGLSLSFPVRNDQARARFAQASIRERQAVTRLRDTELQVRLQVRNAARNVRGGVRQVMTANNALQLAERQYVAELKRFETGTSNTFQVLSFQRQLTLARQRRLNALIALNVALANLELAGGTLLDRFGIEIEDAGTGGGMLEPDTAVRGAGGS